MLIAYCSPDQIAFRNYGYTGPSPYSCKYVLRHTPSPSPTRYELESYYPNTLPAAIWLRQHDLPPSPENDTATNKTRRASLQTMPHEPARHFPRSLSVAYSQLYWASRRSKSASLQPRGSDLFDDLRDESYGE